MLTWSLTSNMLGARLFCQFSCGYQNSSLDCKDGTSDTSASTARSPPDQVLAPPPREEALSPLPPHRDFLCWRGGGRGGGTKILIHPEEKPQGAERFTRRSSAPTGGKRRNPTAIFSGGPEAVVWASDEQLGSTFLHEITARKRHANDYESRLLFRAKVSASGGTGASPLWLTSKHLQQLMFHPDVAVFSCVASSGENRDQVTPVESTVAAEGQNR